MPNGITESAKGLSVLAPTLVVDGPALLLLREVPLELLAVLTIALLLVGGLLGDPLLVVMFNVPADQEAGNRGVRSTFARFSLPAVEFAFPLSRAD